MHTIKEGTLNAVNTVVRRRDELCRGPEKRRESKDAAEAEKDIFHAKMNRYLYEAAEQTTADSNIG